MISPACMYQGCDFRMAVQAFLIGDLFSKDMAFDAVGHPLQVGMGPGQVPGAELGHKRPGRQDQEDQDQPKKGPYVGILLTQNLPFNHV